MSLKQKRIGESLPVVHRLLSRYVESATGCWEWTGTTDQNGYGQLTARNRPIKAHVASFVVHKGQSVGGACVMHKCDNRLCINPSHLDLGTNEQNLDDMRRKGRHAKGTMFPFAKLTESVIVSIRTSTASNASIARAYGVNPSQVSRVRSGKAWKHVPQ